MFRFVLRRLAYLLPVWIGISLVAFMLANLAPGDPARLALQRELGRQPTAEETAVVREQMGLNDAAPIRYLNWLGDALTGDLGTSYRTGQPVLDSLADRFPTTLQIAGFGLLLAIAIAIPLGILAAVYRQGPIDHFSRVIALLGASMPSYWVAYLLILLLSVRLGWLPVAGSQTWQHAVMPALTLGIGGSASLMRLTRSEMLETLNQDYIRTARAKGLRSRPLMLGHALRNTMIPLSTVLGMRFAGMLGGAVIVETIFSWPGIGKLVVDAIFDRDYPMIQGFVIFMGTAFLLINLIVDLGYGVIDPRIRLARR
ncbi:MAG: ABC transporter permease [Chloroflexota bacterium]|nr:ABC transporter permease [Chloroflexia bacterium]MDQ3443778.1 ABC transporter permease [Chloroflexota bacterium]